jgi:uncharacterized repeat protein (TIGR01451 family)
VSRARRPFPSPTMTKLTRLFGAMLIALYTATFAVAVHAQAGAAAAAPRTISNVATIEWDVAGQRMQQASNRVDIVVRAPQTGFSLTAYRLSPNSGQSLNIAAPTCAGAPVTLGAAWQGQSLSPAAVAPINSVRIGEPLLFQLDYDGGNLDPASVDTVTGIILTQSGDRETLTLKETGPNTGQFAGYIQTTALPPPFVQGDCRLSVQPGDKILVESIKSGSQSAFVTVEVDVLADPFGIVFDSRTGTPVSGAKVTLIDVATGLPALVYGDDANSVYPSSLISGSDVRDSAGTLYHLSEGYYRFPLVRPGHYRLAVEPPAGYSAPSKRTPEDMAALRRPDGEPFVIVAASFGGIATVAGPEAVRVGIPLDRMSSGIELSKTASTAQAGPGETVAYAVTVRNPDLTAPTGAVTVTDRFPSSLRLRADTIRVDGARSAAEIASDGTSFSVALPPLQGGAAATVTYALEVRGDARPGDAINHAAARDDRGAASTIADAAIRIVGDTISGRMTIIGRVLDGPCGGDKLPGVPGVRVMLEDGSYAVTDADGRYHFEGVLPGTHVVQLDDATLPADRAATDCARDTRSAGRAFSRFVEGAGGALKRVDFNAIPSAPSADTRRAAAARPAQATDQAASGADRDWFAGQEPGIGWLFPDANHNPRAPIVRVAVKHLPTQTVRLLARGRPVDAVAFDGARKNGAGTFAVSLWRGIPLEDGENALTAEVRNADGSLAQTLTRTVRYGASPIRAELIRAGSVLVADGVTRPVLAVRLTDRDGRPVRHGLVGDFELPAPYYPAVEADAQQARQLAGLERARPFWRVQGDDGMAYIELEPTTASGSVSLRFNFREGQTTREQRLEAWLEPGQRAWTIVGLAQGTLGYNRLDKAMERLGDSKDTLLTDGRLALYAKGRVRGKWLMTLAYDSAKKADESRFGGTIDPQAYYTVYADRSERRYDASSVRKLYLKLERPQFYALFGDYETGIDEPVLARYVRALNGVKAEYRSDRVSATAFAADTPSRHRRDEIQGNGLSGPYALGARAILPNSERITIEVRDRLRSDHIVESRLLIRNADYDIDYRAGTIRFREPILSRSSALDPQFIVADYEVDGVAARSLNAGGRASWRSANEKLQLGATAIHDADDRRSTNLAGADLRYRASASTEVRAEIAVSDNRDKSGSTTTTAGTAVAWQIEAEHHGSRIDVLAYARERETGFGLGQTNAGENGTRKFGLDARAKLTDTLSVTGSTWFEDYLASDARRVAARALVEYRGRSLSARAGFTFADDRLADGRTARSTILQLGATKRLFANKLELDAQTELPVGGKANSVDFPARHRLSARYAVSSGIQLVGAYEIADGAHIDSRTARIGFDVRPWAGARISVSGNMQDIAEYGPRSFAALGLSQSVVLGKHWSADATLDSNKTLSGIDPARVLNPLHPVASGGFIGSGGLTEDFTAVTAGATYRADLWSVTGRAEYRAGEREDRYGLTAAALRQLGEGSALGGALNWFEAKGQTGADTRTASLQLSWAHRPADSRLSWLEKLELRDDRVSGAVAGVPGPLGIPLDVTGDARSRRMVNALSINFSSDAARGLGRTEISIFWGSRYVSERLGDADIKGWSNVVGADIRFDLSDTIDLGLAGTVREGTGGRSRSWSAGPSLGLAPFENGWMSIGWNLVGFHDRDFEDARYTRNGPYVTMRFKFDQLSLQGLGLGRR